ncbi:hydrogen peroxide-inducible genes activator [Pseudoblastomonas halimionae]|uniref:LysR family transcriptional regulator n=1 Tax=Alteriqipengyuania halimionae TaxID=1926630 RepID=A0A6I4U0R3_9SPHN|nr:hydrogen peroxide-inducible genes activator [Alteriqipengyuania halimionae]MXP09366.1 LysR family transcriptional regulator [Alteriqipengyuania halimionae]
MTTLRQMAIFVKLADTGNMGEAAVALGLTQPALSQQLRALETRLDLKLFDRVPKGLELTPAGRQLVDDARAVVSASRDFRDAADHVLKRHAGSIRFGVSPTLGPYLMPRVIRVLHERYPELRLFIREGIPDRQQAELVAGELDMILSPIPVRGKGLHIEPLFREPLRIVAPPDDPLVVKGDISASDLAGRTFLTLDHRHHYHRQLEEICEELGATILGDYQGTSLDALQQMVGSGVGLAVLPQFYLLSEAGGFKVVQIAEPEGWKRHRSIAAAWRSKAAYAELYGEVARIIAEEGRSA